MDCDQDEIDLKELKEKQVASIQNKTITKKKKQLQKKQEDEQALECSICYGMIKDKGIIQECDHSFCFKCIEVWAKKKLTCPQCRVSFNKINRIWKRGKVQQEKIYEFKPIDDSSSSDSDGDNLISLELIMNNTHQFQFMFFTQLHGISNWQSLL